MTRRNIPDHDESTGYRRIEHAAFQVGLRPAWLCRNESPFIAGVDYDAVTVDAEFDGFSRLKGVAPVRTQREVYF